MDDIDLSRRVRSSHPKIPLVFFTGEVRLDDKELEGILCVEKPLPPQELIAAVTGAINPNKPDESRNRFRQAQIAYCHSAD